MFNDQNVYKSMDEGRDLWIWPSIIFVHHKHGEQTNYVLLLYYVASTHKNKMFNR